MLLFDVVVHDDDGRLKVDGFYVVWRIMKDVCEKCMMARRQKKDSDWSQIVLVFFCASM